MYRSLVRSEFKSFLSVLFFFLYQFKNAAIKSRRQHGDSSKYGIFKYIGY